MGDCRADCGHGFPMGQYPVIYNKYEPQFNLTCVNHPINFKIDDRLRHFG